MSKNSLLKTVNVRKQFSQLSNVQKPFIKLEKCPETVCLTGNVQKTGISLQILYNSAIVHYIEQMSKE